MFNFSIVYSVGGPAMVMNRKTFEEVLDNPKVAMICQQIAALVAKMASCTDETTRRQLQDQISALKRGLPALCWHATFKNNKRNSFSAIPSGLAMIDVDHVDEPGKLFESVREVAVEIGLVAAHVTPSTKGLRMVFAMPEGMTIEAMQRWVTDKLQLQGVDGCTKDLARLSFVVPRSYWLYIDYEALFGGNSTFAPSGRGLSDGPITQGDALGYVLDAPSGRQHDATANGQYNGTNANGHGSNANGSNINGQYNGSNANGHGSNANGSNINGQYNGTNANGHGSNINGQYNGTNANGHGSNANGSNINGQYNGTNANGHGSNINGQYNGTNANGHGSNANGSNINGQYNGSNANGHGSNANGHGSNANGSNINGQYNGTNANGHGSNINGQYNGTNANGHGSNANGSNINGQYNGSNANGHGSNANGSNINGQYNGSNANGHGSNANGSNINGQYNGTNANGSNINGQYNGSNATALKGQNIIAQGNALGNQNVTPQTPCRGKSAIAEYEETYKGVPYVAIVDALETLYGGKPEHGNRNTQIFSMACMLRSICNDDPMWIAKILPNYGENEQRWMATIKSACSRNQVRNIPNLMLKAIEMARRAVAQPEEPANAGQTAIALDPDKPPRMPDKLPKLIRHLIKNVPEVCRPSVAHGVFPALATHLSDVNFRLIDGTKKEATFMCVNMARQSSGKASVNKPIEYIMADIKERDDINRRREQEWKDAVGTKGSNKEKPKRPEDLCVQMLVTDMTNAAFVQRLKDANGKYIYTNLEELDLLKQLQTNGTKDVGKIICLCFDNGTYGQERVGLQSITALLPLRWNWNASSTIEKGRDFFRNRLIDGTLSRVNFCTIINDESKEFKYGDYDEQYAAELKPYITNLNLCKGEVCCPQALTMAKRLQQKCTEIALQTEDIIYQEFAYRAVTIAYMKAIVLYIANDMTWDKTIDEFCEWSLDYDLWCKNYFFGEAIQEARNASRPRSLIRKNNMLQLLPDIFTAADAKTIRKNAGKDTESTSHMLAVWVHRGYIIFNEESQMYEKTDKYKLQKAA